MGLFWAERTPKELEKEYERLYLENKEKIFDLAWRATGDEEAAEDIRAKTFLTLHKKFTTVLNHPSPVGWLKQTALYFAKHYQREMAQKLSREAPFELAEQVAASQSGRELEDFLDILPKWLKDIDREMLVLYFYYGYTLREIGYKLNLTHGAARNRMARLLQRLREEGFSELG